MSVGATLSLATPTAESASVGWPERVALGLACLLLLGALGWVLWHGWRRRHPAAAGPRPLPQVPEDLGDLLAGPYKGRYLATTTADDPDLVVTSLGLGGSAGASIAVTDRGVFVERDGSELLFIPAAALSDAHCETATGGTAFGLGALLVIGWKHGRQHWHTGFRAIAVRRHDELVTAIDSLRTGTTVPRSSETPVVIPEVPL